MPISRIVKRGYTSAGAIDDHFVIIVILPPAANGENKAGKMSTGYLFYSENLDMKATFAA
jgi:hypothetical protein